MKKIIRIIRKEFIYLLFLTGTLLISCTERMDIDLDESYTRLVVDGSLTNETGVHCVKLSMTSSFLGGEPDPVVTGAALTIETPAVSYPLTESLIQPGYYYTQQDVKGEPGETYTLHIHLQSEINGIMDYKASCEMFPVAPLDSIGIEYIDKWEIWEVQCYARDPLTEDYYMFDIYKNGILMTDTLSEKFVVDDRMYNGNYTNGIMVGFLNPHKKGEVLHDGDTVTLRISRITREQAYYIWDVQGESGYSNPLFGGPPANVPGNVSDGAMGYFGAYSVAFASTIYRE